MTGFPTVTADQEFSQVRPSEELPWMRYYDPAQHAGDTGHALFDLAIHGRFVTEACERFAAAVAGFPLITVPAGFVADLLPIGLTFMGSALSEPTMIKLAYAFEQANPARRARASTRARASASRFRAARFPVSPPARR